MAIKVKKNSKVQEANHTDMLFLLGGHDLEMEEIKKMLDEHGIPYLDKNLSLGAKISDYNLELTGHLKGDEKLYGIELEGSFADMIDQDGSVSYTLISHHNKYSDRKSSIEQVADIIGVQLNPHQQLVAAIYNSKAQEDNHTGMLFLVSSSEPNVDEIKALLDTNHIPYLVDAFSDKFTLLNRLMENKTNKPIMIYATKQSLPMEYHQFAEYPSINAMVENAIGHFAGDIEAGTLKADEVKYLEELDRINEIYKNPFWNVRKKAADDLSQYMENAMMNNKSPYEDTEEFTKLKARVEDSYNKYEIYENEHHLRQINDKEKPIIEQVANLIGVDYKSSRKHTEVQEKASTKQVKNHNGITR